MRRIDILHQAFFEALSGDYHTLMGLIDTLRETYTCIEIAQRATKYGISFEAAREAIEYLSIN